MKLKRWIAGLVSGVCQCAMGGEIPSFKSSDYVEVMIGTSWQSCVVSGDYRAASRDYPVSCGPKDLFISARSTHIRSRKPSAEDLQTTADTAAALARLPRPGKGPGARYGTREPKTCASRKDPVKGPLSQPQGKDYFICEVEAEGVVGLILVNNVKVDIAPGRSFNRDTDSRHAGIDPRQLVYDIRGGFTHYDCRRPASGDNAFARTHNCSAFEEPSAQGLCFRNTFGDWHCVMHDLHADVVNAKQHLLPPEGN